MKTKLEYKGKPIKKILFYLFLFVCMLVISYLSSRGLSFDEVISNWTVDHLISTTTLIIAGGSLVAVIGFLRHGVFEATCPYCQTKNEIMGNAINSKCKACHKLSVRKDDWLEQQTL